MIGAVQSCTLSAAQPIDFRPDSQGLYVRIDGSSATKKGAVAGAAGAAGAAVLQLGTLRGLESMAPAVGACIAIVPPVIEKVGFSRQARDFLSESKRLRVPVCQTKAKRTGPS